MEIIKAKDYLSREDLDNHVISVYGKSTEPKDVVIKGKEKELQKLKLRHGSVVWGVVAESTDSKKIKSNERPQRGKIYISKLNGQHAQINKSSSRK